MTIRTELMNHQDTIVDFAAPKPFCGIFAGFGVGKSLCALKIIDINGWKIVLIVSTVKAIESTWPDEITKHSNFFYVTLIGSSQDKLRTIRNAFSRFAAYTGKNKPTVIFLTNFDGVKNIFLILATIKPQALFIDESTRIKSAGALRTQVLWSFGKRVPRRYLMTGFPVTEYLQEIYAQIKFLDLGATFGNSYAAFLDKYFKKKGGKYIPKRGAAKRIFDKVKDFCIMVPETVIKLPPKSYKNISLHPSETQHKLLAQLKNEMKVELNNVQININSVYALYTKALQICDGFLFDRSHNAQFFETPKDEALIEALSEVKNEKVLIWTTFIPTLYKLERILKHFGYGVLTLYGETENAGQVVKAFQSSNKYNALIATIFSGDASITLTKCRHAFYYSHWWSNDKRGNSEARIRRKGSEIHQGKSIMYTDIFLKGTVEEVVRGNIKSKAHLVKELKKYFT